MKLTQEMLIDALNRIDETAFELTEDIETRKQLTKDYNLLFDFIARTRVSGEANINDGEPISDKDVVRDENGDEQEI